MDLHRLAEERSIAYHEVIARRLQHDPAILEAARKRVRDWLVATDGRPPYASAWAEILSQGSEAIAGFLIDRGERARALRQSTPFAGALGARERWQLWKEVREREHE